MNQRRANLFGEGELISNSFSDGEEKGETSPLGTSLNVDAIPPAQDALPWLCMKLRLFSSNYCETTETASFLRKKLVVLLSIFIWSEGLAEVQEVGTLTYLLVFVCLGLQIGEDMVQLHYSKADLTNLGNQKWDCLFEVLNKSLTMLFILVFNLQLAKIVNTGFMLIPLVLSLGENFMYLKNPWISQLDDRDMKIFERVFYLLQSCAITAKSNNFVNWGWKEVLTPLWLYFFVHTLYAFLAGLLLLSVSFEAILDFDRQTLGLLRNRILGDIWHVSYSFFHVFGLITLIGAFEKTNSDEDNLFETGILGARLLSIFLLLYTFLLFPILRKFNVNAFDDLQTALRNQIASITQQKYTLHNLDQEDNEKRIAYFLMISPTYFSLLSESQFEGLHRRNDTELVETAHIDLCYICESSKANAILGKCGHGGICCNCAIKLLEKKNECMGCRKTVIVIYKIEAETTTEAHITVQASEIIKII